MLTAFIFLFLLPSPPPKKHFVPRTRGMEQHHPSTAFCRPTEKKGGKKKRKKHSKEVLCKTAENPTRGGRTQPNLPHTCDLSRKTGGTAQNSGLLSPGAGQGGWAASPVPSPATLGSGAPLSPERARAPTAKHRSRSTREAGNKQAADTPPKPSAHVLGTICRRVLLPIPHKRIPSGRRLRPSRSPPAKPRQRHSPGGGGMPFSPTYP